MIVYLVVKNQSQRQNTEGVMSYKTVKCAICHERGSWRKTRDLEKLGIGHGRACKHHHQVQLRLEEIEEQQRQEALRNAEARKEKAYQQAVEEQAVRIRALRIAHSVSWEDSLNKLARQGVPQKALADLRSQLLISESQMSDEQLKKVWEEQKRSTT